MKKHAVIFSLFLASLLHSAEAHRKYFPDETAVQKNKRMQWWREARFGLFIHWGLFSVAGGRWQGQDISGMSEHLQLVQKIAVQDYAALARSFNPVAFDAEEWVRLAEKAGMKYIVITAKHHDGCAMFKSQVTSFNIVDATPYHSDPLKKLAEACHRRGIRLGFYYSQARDWHHPGGAPSDRGNWWDAAQRGDMGEYIRKIAVPQVEELLTNYGPVDIIWWDTPSRMTPAYAEALAAVIRKHPKLITNNRLGGGYEGDTETPENRVPATGYPGDWEACMTMNDNWGYTAWDQNWKSAKTLIYQLVDVASKGGNFLLNVGPTAEGVIPEPSVIRLSAIGQWLDRNGNGESIHGTTASPFVRFEWGRATRKENRLYLHVFDWPSSGVLEVPMLGRAERAWVLNAPTEELTMESTPTGLRISVPREAPDSMVSVVVLDGVGSVDALPPPPLRQNSNGEIILPADVAQLAGFALKLEGHTELGLNNWGSISDVASWKVQVDAPGEFAVCLDYALDASDDGVRFSLNVDGKTVEVHPATTAGRYVLGSVTHVSLRNKGIISVAFSSAVDARQRMNLRAITLRPASASPSIVP
jgi:alpha-L-fucosidase